MSHRTMNTMPTARRGRMYHKSGDNDSRGLGGVCSVLLVSALLVVPPALLYASERSRHVRYEALSDVLDNADVFELNRSGHRPPPGTMVHGTSSRIEAAPSDADMAVSVPGALVLRRNAEYCQWQELQSQRCDTCTRTVKAKDGSSKEESYQCDCVRQYDYLKAWRSYRIQSLIFDQPGAHHNPQRDPMPSRTFVDGDATLTFRDGDVDDGGSDDSKKTTAGRGGGGRDTTVVRASLDPSMLDSGVRGWPYRVVEFTPDGAPPPPSFFSRFLSFLGLSPFRDTTRYEPLRLLRDTPRSIAASRDNFVYVGRGGYFFSPVEKSTYGTLFNWFAQYLEGSLLDWQVGDLMPSCTAGDVRFRYEVQDPGVVSVLGQVGGGGPVEGGGTLTRIIPRVAADGIADNGGGGAAAASIGLVHAGRKSARTMLVDEDADSRNRANLVRALLLLWSVPASRLGGVACGVELGMSPTVVQIEGMLGLFLVLLGAMWLAIWGETYGAIETAASFLAGAVACYLAYRSSYRVGADGGERSGAGSRGGPTPRPSGGWRIRTSGGSSPRGSTETGAAHARAGRRSCEWSGYLVV